MNTLEFFKRVLPEVGHYCAFYLKPGGAFPTHKFVSTKEDLRDTVQQVNQKGGHAVYMAMASFVDPAGGRKQDNVQALRALYMDVDCGLDKPFPSWKEGLQWVSDFVAQTGMPRPLIVFSGNGLHVYWPFDRDVPASQFLPVAHILKGWVPVGEDGKPMTDPKIPTDTARVLRPVGTDHQNPITTDTPPSGNSVHVLIDGQPNNWDELSEYILNNAGKFAQQPVVTGPAIAPPPTAQQRTSQVDLGTMGDFPPSDPHLLEMKCAQIGWAVQNQDKVHEPLWYALLGVAAFCENPQQTAINWSNQHPDFDQAKTIRKMDQWTATVPAPATCQRFRDERPKGCDKCPFAGKIGSPAVIGLKHEEVPLPLDAPDKQAAEIPMPRSYKRTKRGIKMTIDETDVDAFPFDVYPVSYGHDSTFGYEVVRYQWRRPHIGWQPLVFRQALLAGGGTREFATSLADQGIVLGSAKLQGVSQMFLRSYMDELRNLQSMSNLHKSFGWKAGYAEFLLGNRLIKRTANGVETSTVFSSAAISQELVEAYEPVGSLTDYVEATRLFEDLKMDMFSFGFLVSASSILYRFTGLNGGVINFYGGTGVGKSLSQNVAQSIWGNPKALHTTGKTTLAAMYERMGEYNDLIFTVDEATLFSSKELGDVLYSATLGEGKARLRQDSTLRPAARWGTPSIFSANKPLASTLTASGGDQSEAKAQRLLDMRVSMHPLFQTSTEAGTRMYEFFNSNYGLIGPKLVEHLLSRDPDEVRKEINENKKTLEQRYGIKFQGPERFREQFINLADYIGQVLVKLGLIRFNHERAIRWAVKECIAMRAVSAELATTSFDILSEYLNENGDKSVVVFFNGNDPKGNHDATRVPRAELRVRYNLIRPAVGQAPDKGVVLIDRKHFRTWCSTSGFDYKEIMNDIKAAGVDATPSSGKASLAKDTPLKLPQSYVFGINLSSGPFKSVLEDIDAPTMGQMKVVAGV